MDKKTIQKIITAIFVGACVSFLTTMLQGLLDLIKHANWDITGTAAGAIYFFKSTKT